jgi:hypothetical protein
MLILAKIAAIAVLVWFYSTAKNAGEPPIKWAIIGVIGYCLAWGVIKLTLVGALLGFFAKSVTAMFVIAQIPTLFAIAAAFLIRKKLLADAAAAKNSH